MALAWQCMATKAATIQNLPGHVVDGTQPGGITGTAVVDRETIVYASEATVPNVVFTAHDAPNNPGVGCVITDMDDLTEANESKGASAMTAELGGGAARMHLC